MPPRFWLALPPSDWDAVVELRKEGDRLVKLHAHAAALGADESLCGIRIVVAEPRTRWSRWLDDEWGPIVRCPACDAAAR